ncbi:MAG TPA: serine hydrolase domain-containing protein [Microthrixaceae bacterium]|nr:serine hydrolase domain-containing protein [Microthrixaceae bacterium]
MSTIDELLDLARADVDSGRLPACQLAVAKDGELVVFETFGAATNQDRFCVFSATKPIVASAIWLLLGEGKLALSDLVATHIPEFASNGKDVVTVEQVLLHTSGFPMAPIATGEGATPEGRTRRFEQWRLDWEPGSRFEYHPASAHYVLIELIERLEGRDFRDVIEDRVCRPLGLPRLLGLPPDDQGHIARCVLLGAAAEATTMAGLTNPEEIAAGNPGGGGIMTAASLTLFYQGVLHNPGGLWDADVWKDATSNIRCTLEEPLFGIPANRSIGLVIAGDDGRHFMRYGGFGPSSSPASFGHAGAFMQIGWADPATGISFAYCHNGLYDDMMPDGVRGVALSDLAASLEL